LGTYSDIGVLAPGASSQWMPLTKVTLIY